MLKMMRMISSSSRSSGAALEEEEEEEKDSFVSMQIINPLKPGKPLVPIYWEPNLICISWFW
jgi:hypothetical protein